jgi:catechol 2,3-dioxygenase-like lactoylglutathione lyase family enzyme
MPDIATPNLPSRDFDRTQAFYAELGFECGYRDPGWMILHRGPKGSRAVLEFFSHPRLDPYESWFSCCIRLDNLPAMMDALGKTGVPEAGSGIPRYSAPREEASGLTIAYLVDPDGSLIRLIAQE